MSNASTLQANTQDTIEALALSWNSQTIPVVSSTQPLNRDSIDPSPLPNIWICPTAEGEDQEDAATGNLVDVTYKFEIAIVASGNASFEANLPAYQQYREQIRKALARVYYGGTVPGFWRVQIAPREVLNRNMQRDNYDLSILHVHYTVTESAT